MTPSMQFRQIAIHRWLLVALFLIPLVSCAAAPRKRSKRRPSPPRQEQRERHPVTEATTTTETLEGMIAQLVSHGERLLGKPYRTRGVAPWPLDCSGYVSYLYRLLGVSLPRSSGALSRVAEPVTDPQPGDLVFFRGRNARSSRVGHVALVVENNDGDLVIMHSTNSRGVIKHRLRADAYFSKRYLFTGRIPWMAQMLQQGSGCTTAQPQGSEPAAPLLDWVAPQMPLWQIPDRMNLCL